MVRKVAIYIISRLVPALCVLTFTLTIVVPTIYCVTPIIHTATCYAKGDSVILKARNQDSSDPLVSKRLYRFYKGDGAIGVTSDKHTGRPVGHDRIRQL